VTERLVEQARRGDSAAFVALIEERQAAMTRVAMAILGNRTDAEDALQDGLTALWRQLPRLRDSSRFDAWADRILVHACLLVLRRRRRRGVREIPAPTGAAPEVAPAVADPTSIEDTSVDRDAFRRAFETLDGDARALIVLRHLEDRSIPEIAAILRIPEGTVKSRLFTARRALETALGLEEPA
jgi:RNA polymerase sigma-70 factor (ECF subfamily)